VSLRSLVRQSRIEEGEDDGLGIDPLAHSSSEQSIALLTHSSAHSATPIGDIAPHEEHPDCDRVSRPSVLRSAAIRMMSLHRHGSISSQTSDSRHAHQLLQNVGRTIQRTSSQLRKSKAYHLLYLVMLPTYTVCGAFLFQWLDGEHDEQEKLFYEDRCRVGREQRLSDIKGQCAQIPTACFELMQNFTYEVENCYRDWHTANRTITHSMAEFSNALIYAFSVYTTIGYGNVAADTTACRIATIFYGALGIPLFFAFVKEEGNLCRIFFIHLYKKVMKLRKKCFAKCKTNEPSSSQEQIANGNCLGVPSPTFGPSQAESGEVTLKDSTPVKKNKDTRHYSRQYSSNSLHECDRNERRKVFAAGCITLIAYVLVASCIVDFTTEFDYITSVYFLFNSVALIGFGDVFPSTPTVIIVHAPFMIFGVILFSMCYFIMQEEIRDRTFEASRRARISISKYGQSIINQARSPWSRRNSPLFDNNSDGGGGNTSGPSPSSFERMRKRRQSAPAIALTGPTGKTARFRDI
ncbi:hypothetical protein PENTCL1PPCAC_30028, partial [Pristionchus entomophagus]